VQGVSTLAESFFVVREKPGAEIGHQNYGLYSRHQGRGDNMFINIDDRSLYSIEKNTE
jgi:hypothetical protein